MRPEIPPISPEDNPYPETVMDYGDNPLYNAMIKARNWVSGQVYATPEQRKDQWQDAILDSVAPISMGARAIFTHQNKWTQMLKDHFPKVYDYLDKSPAKVKFGVDPITKSPDKEFSFGLTDPRHFIGWGAASTGHLVPELNRELIEKEMGKAPAISVLFNEPLMQRRGRDPRGTAIHEAGHVIDDISTFRHGRYEPIYQAGLPVDYPGQYDEMLRRTHNRDPKQAALVDITYNANKPHGVVELRAQKQLQKSGLNPDRPVPESVRDAVERINPATKPKQILKLTHDPDATIAEPLRERMEDIVTDPQLKFKTKTMMLFLMPDELTMRKLKAAIPKAERQLILGNLMADKNGVALSKEGVRVGKGKYPKFVDWFTE